MFRWSTGARSTHNALAGVSFRTAKWWQIHFGRDDIAEMLLDSTSVARTGRIAGHYRDEQNSVPVTIAVTDCHVGLFRDAFLASHSKGSLRESRDREFVIRGGLRVTVASRGHPRCGLSGFEAAAWATLFSALTAVLGFPSYNP
jgi:hypothetical protein